MHPGRGLYYGWVMVAALGLTTIVSYGTTEYLFGVLVVPIGRELGWSRGSISGAYSLMLLVAGLLGVPVGRLVDRYGARAVMAVGSALAGLTLVGLAGVHALWQFYLLWAGGMGLAIALTYYPVSFTVVANWFARRRGAAFALLTTLGGLASPVFIPLAGALVVRLGWRETLLVLALAQLAVALPLHALVLRRHPEDLGLLPDGAAAAEPAAGVAAGVALRPALRRGAFWLLTGAYALAALATNVILVHQIPFLVGRGDSGVLAAGVAGGVGVASLPGRYVLNRLSDRLGAQPLLCLVLGVQAAGVVILLAGRSIAWQVAYAAVYGLAFGASSPLRATVMADRFGRRAYGAITAVQGVPVALCAATGPLAAGWLYDRLGSYTLALGCCAGALLLAGGAVALTRGPARPTAMAPAGGALARGDRRRAPPPDRPDQWAGRLRRPAEPW